MKRATFTVLFFVKRTKKQRDGKIPIFTRLTINGQRVEFAVKKSVSKANWDKRRGKVRGNSKEAKQTNAYLEAIKMGLNEARLILEESRKEVTALTVKNTYLGVDEVKITVLDAFEKHNNQCKDLVGIDCAYGTYQKYSAEFLASRFLILKFVNFLSQLISGQDTFKHRCPAMGIFLSSFLNTTKPVIDFC
jgi:hypothetical protein